MSNNTLIELFEEYDDDRRHPLVHGCDDWETIGVALGDYLAHIGQYLMPSPGIGTEFVAELTGVLLRCLAETIYAMGYERGQEEASTNEALKLLLKED